MQVHQMRGSEFTWKCNETFKITFKITKSLKEKSFDEQKKSENCYFQNLSLLMSVERRLMALMSGPAVGFFSIHLQKFVSGGHNVMRCKSWGVLDLINRRS